MVAHMMVDMEVDKVADMGADKKKLTDMELDNWTWWPTWR